MTNDWTAVVPIKRWELGKSRLAVPGSQRHDITRAFALDTLDVVAACESIARIVVVSSEPALSPSLDDIAVTALLPDPTTGTPDDLNVAIGTARTWARQHAARSPIVVVPTDLPALTAATLEEALRQLAWFDRTHVPDARGVGTTLLAASRPDDLVPRFGAGSERAHAREGSVPVLDVDPGVRLDVDDLEDLARAAALTLAPRSAALLALG